MLTLSKIRQLSSSVGFDDCGIALPEIPKDDTLYLKRWLEKGYNGSMGYMAQNIEKRTNPKELYPYCRSIVVCLLNYYKSQRQTGNAPYVAMSGLSRQDYHHVVKGKLTVLEELIRAECEEKIDPEILVPQHIFCDSAPVFERRLACLAGLGIIGKNHLFIHPRLGSFVHIGILMLPIDISDENGEKQHESFNPCADCDRCIKNCPTGALRADMFDARRCVSYLTIERKEPLERKYEGVLKEHLYGCDNCQLVCPCNQNLKDTECNELMANNIILGMSKEDWEQCSQRAKLKLLHRLAKRDKTE